MNWYLVSLLFAQLEIEEEESVMCETCHVLFSAPSALAAHDKAEVWAAEHIKENQFHFVGVEHIQSIDEEPADGVEVSGSFYESKDVWQRRAELIPAKADIPVVKWEQNSNVPVADMMTEQQKSALKRILDDAQDN